MAFRLNNKLSWFLAVVAAAISIALAIWPVAEEVGGQSNALFLGMLPSYLVLSSYLSFRLIAWIDAKGFRFGKIIGVVLSVLFLLGSSWAVLGRYFYLSAAQGLQCADQLVIDFVLRRSVQGQHLFVVLLSLIAMKKGGTDDLVGSLLVAGVLAVLILG